jgi:1-acylglycerone phosphate reductase
MLWSLGNFPAPIRLKNSAQIDNRCGQGGIGEALVMEYTRRGIHAIATVLPNEPHDHLSKAGITFFPLDVTVEKSVVELKAWVLELTGGKLDILVNCASVPVNLRLRGGIHTDIKIVELHTL